MTPERKTLLQYAAFLLGTAGADEKLPAGSRERLGMMAGRIALELDVIEGVAGGGGGDDGMEKVTDLRNRMGPSAPPNVPVPYKEPAKLPREVAMVSAVKPHPLAAFSRCIDGHMNHRWLSGFCARCNKRR